MDLTPQSTKYLKETDLEYRKIMGQYFTPKNIREELIGLIPKNLKNPVVLDPACGSGEFLLTAKDYFDKPKLEGWEIDNKLVTISKSLVPGAVIKQTDSLLYDSDQKFDVVIGNPPYFEMKPDKETKIKFKNIMGGRCNIFSLFVYLGLELLKEGGYLAYVIPPSMNNGAYFAKLREYIVKTADIKTIKILKTDLFSGAQQLTMLMVLQKTKNTGKYQFKVDGIRIFSQDWEYLEKAFKGKKTLETMGFRVRTGKVVWNQNKTKLSNNKNKTPLIWSHNIGAGGKLVFDNKENKLQYVDLPNPERGPALVVNRITGASTSAKIRAALIPEGFEFFAENHCNVIYPPIRDGEGYDMNLILEIQRQLRSPEKVKIFQSITGNTQISKNELEKLFPID